MVVEVTLNTKDIPDLMIIHEAYNNVRMALFKQVISNRPEYTGTLRVGGNE